MFCLDHIQYLTTFAADIMLVTAKINYSIALLMTAADIPGGYASVIIPPA